MRSRREILSNILKNKELSGFEKAVYKAVSKIPDGEIRSYKWVAKMTGRPNAYRAVGNALNKNPYSPIIPCHRVVKSNGSIGGYSKRVGLKMKMLKAEGVDLADSRCYNLKNPLTRSGFLSRAKSSQAKSRDKKGQDKYDRRT